ncbi:hypothetical protein D3C81_1847970 [compost metagenome]
MQLSPFTKRVALPHRLDLDHFGTELSHQAGGERGGNQTADFNDADALQWPGHGSYLFLFLEFATKTRGATKHRSNRKIAIGVREKRTLSGVSHSYAADARTTAG